jgi:putative phosphoesterase
MILAALGDIHGNLPALEAVLHDVDEEGIERIVNVGDCVAGSPWPNETIDLLRARKIPSIQGLTDRHVVRFGRKHQTLRRKLPESQFAALERAYDTLHSDRLEWLRTLPKTMTLTIDGIEVFLCHGTPASASAVLRDTDPDLVYQRQREVIPAPILVHGATHTPHVRTVDGTLFANPGAVGIDDARPGHASYAVIIAEDEPWTAEIRWIPFGKQTATPVAGSE